MLLLEWDHGKEHVPGGLLGLFCFCFLKNKIAKVGIIKAYKMKLASLAKEQLLRANSINPFNPKLIMQILPTIQGENDWVM